MKIKVNYGDHKDCISNENNILNINNEFLELLLILSFHISILNYEELKSYLNIINYYFKDDIFIQDINYNNRNYITKISRILCYII